MKEKQKITYAVLNLACIAFTALFMYSIGYENGSVSARAKKPAIVCESVEPTVIVAQTVASTEPATVQAIPETGSPAEEPTEIMVEMTEPPEFPVAQKIWDFLKSQGFSDAVSAGILGNMMAEAGGQTFNIQPDVYDDPGDYYGICQWNRWNYQEVQGETLDFQLQYLMDTIHSRFSDNDYERFVNSDTPQSAAKRFAIWYEGCAEWSYPVRESNAQEAYNYFAEE